MLLFLALLLLKIAAFAQEEELPAVLQQSVENEAAATNSTTEDDEQWQQLNDIRRHPISVNHADQATWAALGLLTPVQIDALLKYRQLLGDLLSIYELQAVPGFDQATIRKILPFIQLDDGLKTQYRFTELFTRGQHTLLTRYSRVLELSKGYRHTDSTLPAYSGSPYKLFIRYRYNFSRHASYGVLMKKDAGESLFKGYQRQGFDFYSAHLFLTDIHPAVQFLALGDFVVNMGQGLIQWHSHAAGKGAGAMMVKKEGDILRPYSSSGEYYFFRGAGITLKRKQYQLTVFGSLRKLDGSVSAADTAADELQATAIISSGYHRTATEAAKRGSLQQLSTGAALRYMGRWQFGINGIMHQLQPGLYKPVALYNQFDFRGDKLLNVSLDYAGTLRNTHLFGEVARDLNGRMALLQGLIISVAPSADMTVVYRNYDRAYQSLYSKGFGESYKTMNEQGCYIGISTRIANRWTAESYIDFFRFPWLKYGINNPSDGKDWLLQINYAPSKKSVYSLRAGFKTNGVNILVPENPIKVPATAELLHVRLQALIQYSKQLQFTGRMEYSRFSQENSHQNGLLFYTDAQLKPRKFPLKGNLRLVYFTTGGYQARIYAYEKSVLYENSIGQYYGQGWQYYLNVNWRIRRHLNCWWRWSQVIYPGSTSIGSGWDQINGNKKSQVQMQFIYDF